MQSMVPVQSAWSNTQVHETDEIDELEDTQILTEAEIKAILAEAFDEQAQDIADGYCSSCVPSGEELDTMFWHHDIENNPIIKIVK